MIGIESADPRGRRLDRAAARVARPSPPGAGHDRLRALPGRRRPVRRDGVAAAMPRGRRRRGAADRTRGRRPRELPGLRGPAGRTARRGARLAGRRRPRPPRPSTSSKLHREVIDWILAERIAGMVAGTGTRRLPAIDSPRWPRVRGAASPVHGLRPLRRCRAGRDQPTGVGRHNISSMRVLLDPVLKRAGGNLGPLKPAVEIGVGLRAVAPRSGLCSGYLAQRVLGQYELVLLDEAETTGHPGCCSCSRTSGAAVAHARSRRAGIHDLGRASRGHPRGAVRGRALASPHVASSRARAARER